MTVHPFRIVSRAFALLCGVVGMSCSLEAVSPLETDSGTAPSSSGLVEMTIDVGTDTRTVNDGDRTLWTSGDALSVLYAGTGAKSGFASSIFSWTGEGDTFTGTVSGDLAGRTDWYAVYPYDKGQSSASAVHLTVPSEQTQTGNSSRKHFAGPSFPMYGKTLDVQASADLGISLRNALAGVQFNFTNGTGRSVVVKEIAFTSTGSIAGSFTVDLTAKEPVPVPDEADGSRSVLLHVEDGEPVGPSGQATFIAGVAPHTVPAGGQLTVQVEAVDVFGNQARYERQYTLPSGTAFKAGVIKQVAVDFSPALEGGFSKVTEEPADWTGKYILVDEESGKVFAPLSEYAASGYTVSPGAPTRSAGQSAEVDLERYVIKVTDAGVEHVNFPGYEAYHLQNADRQYIFFSKGEIHIQETNIRDDKPYYHVFIWGPEGVSVASSGAVSGWSKYYLGFRDGLFGYVKDDGARTVQLYRLEDGGGDAPAPGEIVDLGTFNLENDSVRRYLDEAEKRYTDELSTSIVSDYTSGSARKDIPNPVTVKWTGSASAPVDVVVYGDEELTTKVVSLQAASGAKSVQVYNLIPGRTYYYTVSGGETLLERGLFRTEGRRRMIKVSDEVGANHANNCRDLGGLKTADGRTVRYGYIFRGTNMDETSDAERRYLVDDLNVGLDIDMRKQDGSTDEGPANPLGPYGAEQIAFEYNWTANSLQNPPEKMKATIQGIIDTAKKGKATYFHCKVGADRTGYMGLLLESLLGVSVKDSSTDFELTSFSCVGTRRRTDGNLYRECLKLLESQEGATLQEKAEAYLLSIGISKVDIQEFRKIMLE